MKKRKFNQTMKRLGLGAGTLLLSFALIACTGQEKSNKESKPDDTVEQTEETANQDATESTQKTVMITDFRGQEVEIPVNPERVVSLDSRTFESLDDWGVKLVAAPKPLIPSHISYSDDADVVDIGNHREPDLEALAATDPQLVIVGQRFARLYEDIKELLPNAIVVDFNFDVSEEADSPGENLLNGLKQANHELAKIFEKEEEANELAQSLDQAVLDAKAAYQNGETVMGTIVSGGEIGYSAPSWGRVWGPVYEILGWEPALVVDESSSDHQGDDVSVEAIAQSNPDWLMVLDRDAAAVQSESTPAEDVIEGSTALSQTTVVQEGQIYYAPKDTYTNESIQTWIQIFTEIAEAMK